MNFFFFLFDFWSVLLIILFFVFGSVENFSVINKKAHWEKKSLFSRLEKKMYLVYCLLTVTLVMAVVFFFRFFK